jgi:hypothetical protein
MLICAEEYSNHVSTIVYITLHAPAIYLICAATQAETDLQLQRERADTAELEKKSLKQQIAELREKFIKTQSELDDVKTTMENMVPR